METLFISTSQLAKLILSPENHVFLCAFLVIYGVLNRARRLPRSLAIASGLWIVILFSPLGSWAVSRYERLVPAPAPESLRGRTALILAGGTGLYHTPSSQMVWFGNSARVQEPLRLFRQGVLKKLVFTGGEVVPVSPQFLGEAASVSKWWQEMGVPADAITLEQESRNTHENILLSLPLLPKNEDIVLITSAFHLPRALSVARKVGLTRVIAYPVDYKITDSYDWWSWNNLVNTERLLFEVIGLLAYRVAGFGA